jgi:hypothetical protein
MDSDRNSPATKGDLADLEDRLTGSMRELEERIMESMRDIQTEMLKGFYGFTQTVSARFQEQDQTEISLKRRIATMEDRILEIEKRLNFPPHAA